MEAVECGAAALSIVLRHFGRYVALEDLRVACGVSRDGSKASHIVKAARQFGLIASGFSLSTESLHKQAFPVVVYWNFNHFLVVEGFGADKVYLNDPATGPRVVSAAEFDASFTGIVLCFRPGPDFKPGGTPDSFVDAMRKRLQGSERALLYLLLVSLALVIPGLLIPTFSRLFIDEYVVRGAHDWLPGLFVGMAATALMRAALTYLQQSRLLQVEMQLALTSSSRFFWHVLRLPVEFFQQRYVGDVASRVASNDAVARLLTGQLATQGINALMAVFFAALMFQYNALLATVAVAFSSINLLALRLVARHTRDTHLRLLQERGKLMSTTLNGIFAIETLKASGREHDLFTRWSGHKAKAVNSEQRLAVQSRLLSSLPTLLTALNAALVLTLGGFSVMEGTLSVGALVAFQSLLASFTEPVNKLVTLGTQLQQAQGDVTRLDDVLNYPIDAHTQSAAQGQTATPKLNGRLELRHIQFGYSRLEKPLIEDFNLSLSPGKRVALVGGSGSGKSTLVRLIAGLHAPWNGEILFDGVPRSALPRAVLSNSLAYVDQNIFLFEGSVRDNLTLWDGTVADADLLQAAKDACIHAVVSARAGGYDASVAEGGENFSGGERQRLEIARALALNPSLLLLDEATSALDPIVEKQIDDHLRRRGCTCLIVAHRLSTVRDCDEIIVLDKGVVVGRGTHDELMAQSAHYAALIHSE